MDPASRRRKKLLHAQRLRGVAPAATLRQGLELMAYSRQVAEAADRAQL